MKKVITIPFLLVAMAIITVLIISQKKESHTALSRETSSENHKTTPSTSTTTSDHIPSWEPDPQRFSKLAYRLSKFWVSRGVITKHDFEEGLRGLEIGLKFQIVDGKVKTKMAGWKTITPDKKFVYARCHFTAELIERVVQRFYRNMDRKERDEKFTNVDTCWLSSFFIKYCHSSDVLRRKEYPQMGTSCKGYQSTSRQVLVEGSYGKGNFSWWIEKLSIECNGWRRLFGKDYI